jgi:hypothetical protein
MLCGLFDLDQSVAAKVEVKFDGTGDFNPWKVRMKTSLTQNGCHSIEENETFFRSIV